MCPVNKHLWSIYHSVPGTVLKAGCTRGQGFAGGPGAGSERQQGAKDDTRVSGWMKLPSAGLRWPAGKARSEGRYLSV